MSSNMFIYISLNEWTCQTFMTEGHKGARLDPRWLSGSSPPTPTTWSGNFDICKVFLRNYFSFISILPIWKISNCKEALDWGYFLLSILFHKQVTDWRSNGYVIHTSLKLAPYMLVLQRRLVWVFAARVESSKCVFFQLCLKQWGVEGACAK